MQLFSLPPALYAGAFRKVLHVQKGAPVKQLLRIMKLTAIIMLVACLHASAEGSAQITLNASKVPLQKALSEIQKQSGYDFFYSYELMQQSGTVSIRVKNVSLKEALDQLLAGIGLTYRIIDKTVVIKKKEELMPDRQLPPPIDVKGRILNERGEPVVASIVVKGDTKGTTSNKSGEFTLTGVESNAVLVISAINIETFEVKVNNRTDLGNIVTVTKVGAMEEFTIVSTGYTSIPKERATGSFGAIRSKDLEKRVSANLLERIEGEVAGLLVNVGSPDRSLTPARDNFSIRGVSTINSEKKPLIVLDGFPTELDLVNINPENIENITVLKDAAAASIWGVRAANGVLVIESKKGKLINKAQVEFSSIISLTGRARLDYLPVLKSRDYLVLEKELVDKNLTPMPASPLRLFQPPVSRGSELAIQLKQGLITQAEYDAAIAKLAAIDVTGQYQDYLLRAPISQQYNLAISGGSSVTRNRLSVSYADEYPNAIGDYGRRLSISFSNQTNISSRLIFSGESFLTVLNQKNNGIGLRALQPGGNNLLPYDQIVDENGNAGNFIYQAPQRIGDSLAGKGFLPWQYNYLDELGNADNTFRTFSYRVVAGLKYSVAPVLSLEAKYMLEKEIDKTRNYYNPSTYFTRNLINSYTTVDTHVKGVPQGGVMDQQDLELNNYSLRGQINFNPNFGEHHRLDLIIGTEIRETSSSGYSNRAYGYDDRLLTSAVPNYAIQYKTVFGNQQVPFRQAFSYAKDRYISAFGNFNYTFRGKYSLSGSFRKDDSNLFGASSEFRSVPLWSVGAMWNAKDESFMSDIAWLNRLNLRATAGYNGNVNKTTSPYLIIQPLPASNSPMGNYNADPYATVYNPGNPMLRWERVRTFNVGADFAAFNSRISGSVDAYWRKSMDLLGRVETNPTYGFTNILANQLEMTSQGIDIELQGTAVKTNQFTWIPGMNLSFNRNKVTRAYFQQNTLSYYTDPSNPIEGQQLGSIFTYKYAKLNENGNAMIYDAKGATVLSDLPSLDETDINALEYQGVTMPRYYGGISNTIRYRNFELYLLFTFKGGHKFMRPAIDFVSNLQSSRVAHEDWARRWQKPGDEATTNVPSVDPQHLSMFRYYRSDLFVEDATYLRWRDITLTYRVPVKKVGWKLFQSLELSLSGKNLAILTANKHNIDPDYLPTTSAVTLPPAKAFVFSIRTNF